MAKKLFEFSELRQNPDPRKRRAQKGHGNRAMALSLKHLHLHQERIRNVKDLVGRPPEPEQAYFLFTHKSFNAFTFIPYLLREHGYINELYISTFNINQRILNSFVYLMSKSQIQSIYLLVSESIKKRLPRVYDQLQMYAGYYQYFTVSYNWNHSKITLGRVDQHYYVIEGSGNWSENAAQEQYLFLNNQQVYEFRKQCILGT